MILGLGIDSWITIATLVALMAALLFTRLRTDVVFWGVIGILFVTGVLDKSEAFSGLINSSVIIVGVMFVIVTGLSRTGVLLWMTKHILGNPKSPVQRLLRLMLSVGLLSPFVNNTSVVALFVVARHMMRTLCREFRMRHKAKDAQTVVDGHQYDILRSPFLTVELRL